MLKICCTKIYVQQCIERRVAKEELTYSAFQINKDSLFEKLEITFQALLIQSKDETFASINPPRKQNSVSSERLCSDDSQ